MLVASCLAVAPGEIVISLDIDQYTEIMQASFWTSKIGLMSKESSSLFRNATFLHISVEFAEKESLF